MMAPAQDITQTGTGMAASSLAPSLLSTGVPGLDTMLAGG